MNSEQDLKVIDLLLLHGIVIPMDSQRSILEDGAVAIEGDRVLQVGLSKYMQQAYKARLTIDCTHKIVLPGLVDAHGHAGHSLFKTIASDTPSFWSRVMTRVYQNYTTDEFWYIEGRLSALERLKSGITCGLSVIGSEPRSDDPVFANNHARAYAEVGVREVVAVGPCNPPWPHTFTRWVDGHPITRQVSFEEALAGAEAAIDTWNHGADDRIRVYITPFLIVPSLSSSGPTPPDIAPTLTAFDREQSRKVREIAAKYNTRIHSDAFGGMVKLASKDEFGLIGADVSLQHCNGISLEEVRILAETDTRVGHTAGASQGLARTPVPELIDAGVTVAIVTDGTSPKNPFDLFQAMRKTQLVQHVLLRDPYYLPPGKLLEMVTIDAARALGWDDQIGSLEAGKKADVVIVNLRQPHLTPEIMPVHRLVFEAVGADVESVIVDGKVILENREVKTVSEEEILTQAQLMSIESIERASLHKHMELPKSFWSSARMTFDEVRNKP